MVWGAIAGAVASYALNRHSARSNADYQNDQTRDMMVDAPGLQMEGFRRAGLNPMLAYGNINFPGSSANTIQAPIDLPSAMSQSSMAASQAQVADASSAKMAQETKTESFRTAIANNEAIRGNYALQELAGKLDAAMKVTGEVGANAISALEQPRIRAGLEELRAAFASAKNDAAVYEALNSKAVQVALDVLGRLTGSGNAIAGAVDRYRARSQRGDIINLNKE